MIKNPSNSKIQVKNFPLLRGRFDYLKVSCVSEIQKLISTGRKFVIGHTSKEYARPRFKGYEKHKGLDVNEIFLISGLNSKSEAHKLEGFLIDYFWSNYNLMNVKRESKFNDIGNFDEYFVYIACQ
jgi:hypothetical protein